MVRLNVWIPCYDDLAQLEQALASLTKLPDYAQVYVVDGRYAAFDGETILTPGAENLCASYEWATYTHPPDLPIGDPDVPDQYRSPQHEQAKWVNYELLPGDEWALEMDTDERLDSVVDHDALAELDPRRKYTPQVFTPDDEQLWPAVRLYQPDYWTFWIDDVMFWRAFYPRDTSMMKLFEAHITTGHRNTGYGGETEAITLRNHGEDRPDEYQNRRADHLERMGSDLAAKAIRDGRTYTSTVDLSEYRDDQNLGQMEVTDE